MNKFSLFFKKELKDLLTLQSLIPLILMLVIFSIMGGVVGNLGDDISKSHGTIAIMDEDDSKYSKAIMDELEQHYELVLIEPGLSETQAVEKLEQEGLICYAKLPKGLGQKLFENNEKADIKTVCLIKSLSIMGSAKLAAEDVALNAVNDAVSVMLIEMGDSSDSDFVKNPVNAVRKSYLNGKSAVVSAGQVSGAVMSQSMFLPIALFVVIMFAAQMTSASMATEKSDKTFETLLSMPVSRTAILMSKMTSVGIMGIIYAAVYLLGFSFITSGGGFGGGGSVSIDALEALGLTLGIQQYLIIGINVLLSIMIALSIAIIIGVAAKDIKAAQGAMAPLILIVMVPYVISLAADINSMPMLAKVFVYLIPFSHTFSVISNIYMGNWLMIGIGTAYQVILLIITVAFTLKIFNSDKALTMNLEFRRKRRVKKG